MGGEWAKHYFGKKEAIKPTHERPKEILKHPLISSYYRNKEIVEAYEDSGLHWRECQIEVRLMRFVEELSAIHRLWCKNLASHLNMSSLEFEAFRRKYATQQKALIRNF